MKKLLAAIILMASTMAWANPLQEGLRAHNRGDYTTALKRFELLAEQGNTTAQINLRGMYSSGQSVVQDYKQAARATLPGPLPVGSEAPTRTSMACCANTCPRSAGWQI
jgi:TPR repeat protein